MMKPSLLLALFLSITMCSQRQEHQTEMSQHRMSSSSIYQLTSQWTTQDGETISLAALRGRPQVLAMVYTSCEYVCPRIVGDMKRIEAEVQKRLPGRVGFTVVSIDPKRDIPKKLKAYAANAKLDPHRWKLLTGQEENIRELAAVLGVTYQKIDEKDFVHSNTITIVNAAGEIVHQRMGLEGDLKEMIRVLEKLLR